MSDLKVRKEFIKQELNNQEASDFLHGKSDREIWAIFKRGNKEAFRHIYLTHYEHLYRFGHRITKDSELIKDCIQDLFIELRNSTNISDTDSIRFYLLKVLKIKLEKSFKRQKDFIPFKPDELFDGFPIELSDEEKHINLQIEEEQKAKLQYLLNKLTDNQRQALYYFYYENLSYKEVAEIMHLSHVRSARNLIYKALNGVRAYLKTLVLLLVSTIF